MKKLSFFLVFMLSLPLSLVGCEAQEKKLNSYKISAIYDDQMQTLTCEQEVDFCNQTENALQNLSFFLYANSFAEWKDAVSKSSFNKAYPNGESYGNITITNAKIDGCECAFSVNDKQTILSVNLLQELFPDESVKIQLEYVVQLANINHRLGYGDDTTNLANFFPILCVYENGFVENDFSQYGDPFYSDVANFEVEISFPEGYVVASSGDIVSQNDTKLVAKAEKVRDFALVISTKFSVLTDEANGICVKYFYYDDAKANEHLQTAKFAMQYFCDTFGKYPYSQISVVKNDFCFGGMEYPNLVMISDQVTDDSYDYVIVHELAHQWWYGLVGNNEFEEAWIDESLTEYSTALFFEEHNEYGFEYETIVQNAHDTYTNFVKIYTDILGQVNEKMDRKLNEFDTEPEYVNCVYTKGVLMYDSVRELIGKKKFEKCLKNYFEKFRFQNVKRQDLINSFSRSAGRNLQGVFNAWLDGKVIVK